MSGPETFFEEQFKALEEFLLNPEVSILRLVIDPEMHRVPIRFLESKDQDDTFRHLIINHSDDFDTHVHWNNALLKGLDSEIDTNAAALVQAGIDIDALLVDIAQSNQPWKNFLNRAEQVANGLTDYISSLVFVLSPAAVRDELNWLRTIKFFADRTGTSLLKFIVFEQRVGPLLDSLKDHPKVQNQLFWLSPNEIEKRAMANIAPPRVKGVSVPNIDPGERRRALATIGVMASGRKDYETAKKAQLQLINEAKKTGDPTEIALALYNLGNTYLGAEEYEEATEVLMQAADGCSYHELDQLAPMVFSNLGIALHHAGEPERAFEFLRIARNMFHAQNNLPGEAYVCDCLALLNHQADNREEAQKAWNYALSLYDKISNPDMQDVKRGGRTDIISKLKHFGYADG